VDKYRPPHKFYLIMWKDIKGYEGLYQISDSGEVKSMNYNHTNNEKLLKLRTKKGYLEVSLSKNGKQKFYLVHRLVAMHFLDNPNNYSIVNHKDENG